jgi:hypothetical protein
MISVVESSLIDRFTNGLFQGSHTPCIAFLWDNPFHLKPPVLVRLVLLFDLSLASRTVLNAALLTSKGFINALGVSFLDGMQSQPSSMVIT